ncbi:hypothetical protein [Brevibacillus fulvus]|uniref:Uncharacterized protein n=1 Tax=Brevibacillus fulvus TaxID=1125967 RepID=A0A939BSV0_9BACL|nr:hypothetical protein [Brevibacillus fulvus]MBM7591122.1 hypothetical protein [Brevibacillus fulvus]
MMICEYANEQHLVTEFIRYTHKRKLCLASGQALSLFVWGHELWLPEGGKKGYTGAIDLLATDETGNVWLIEAKQSANPELSPLIWENQIVNYRRGLARRTPEEVSLKTRRFLLNKGELGLAHPFLSPDCDSLLEAFCSWADHQGMDRAMGSWLYNQTMKQIANETVISAVMADTFRKDVWEGRPADDKPYGYIVVEGRAEQFQATAVMTGDRFAAVTDNDYGAQAKSWTELVHEKRRVKPTPETVGLYLAPQIQPLYLSCLDQLRLLNWDGRYKSNTKAFIVDMPTKYGVPIRIHLGWVDFDASFPIEHRLPGELGLKFNIDFRHFKNSQDEQLQATGYRLAKRLAEKARYNGRGKGLNIQYRELSAAEKADWDWEMYRRVDHENRDYLGRSEEIKDFAEAWTFLSEIC